MYFNPSAFWQNTLATICLPLATQNPPMHSKMIDKTSHLIVFLQISYPVKASQLINLTTP